MTTITCTPIGTIKHTEEGFALHLEEKYLPALQALQGFSHLNILWWCHESNQPEYREILETPKPYQKAPDTMGIFATRSPVRPNPIALSVSGITHIDEEKGIIYLDYIDAHADTPVLDIKPYTPSADRVEHPTVPGWCSHWPKSLEESEDFDWENEFLF